MSFHLARRFWSPPELQRFKSILNGPVRHAGTTSYGHENSKDTAAKHEKSINQVILLGRVGADPQKRGSSDHPVVIFSLATNTPYDGGDSDLLKQKTDWHRVCVFKPSLRDMVYQYMTKGNRVLVQGRISYSTMRDENGDKTNTVTSIIANDVTFVSSERVKDTEVQEEMNI